MMSNKTYYIHGFTHRGGRSVNEDAFFIYSNTNKIIGCDENELRTVVHDSFCAGIMDGVGGYPNGRETSLFIANDLLNSLSTLDLTASVTSANQKLCCDPSHGFSTLVGLHLSENGIDFISCGDSRLYAIHDHEITQLTTDDNTANVLMTLFALSFKEAHEYGYLTECVGKTTEQVFTTHYRPFSLTSPETYVLLTDGAYTFLEDYWDEIVASNAPAEHIIRLIHEFLASSDSMNHDNLTAIIITPKNPNFPNNIPES